MRRNRGSFTFRPSAQILVDGNFITPPFNFDAPNILSGNVRVRFRESPEARPASVHVFGFPPVLAVFTRPRLGTLARSVKKHVFFELAFIKGCFASDFIRHTVVDLEIPRFASFGRERISGTIPFNQRILERFGERPASASSAPNDLVRITKTVSRDLAACFRVGCFECTDRNAVFPNVPDCSRRMIVAVQDIQFFTRYRTVFNQVVDDCARSLGSHLSAQLKDFRMHPIRHDGRKP